MLSPDQFLHTRLVRSQMKASNFSVQSMEFRSHGNAVCEYQLDMLHHLLAMEAKTLPSLALIKQQPEMRLSMRPQLLDFLMGVISVLNLSKSTFPLTVNLIDRYCSTRIVKKQHYQLLGLTALWISCKNLDSKFKIPTLADLRKICMDSYYKELFIEMEKHILKSLDWIVGSPTFDQFVDLFLNVVIHNNNNPTVAALIKKSSHRIKLLATYIGELFQFYPNIYFDYTSSQIALISILVSVLTLKIPVNLISLLNFYNDLVEEDILSVTRFQFLFNKSFFKNLIKILANPPKSLETKYFAPEGKYTQLIKSLVECATDSLETLLDPETPVVAKPPSLAATSLPLTPVSNSTSPKRANDAIFHNPITASPFPAKFAITTSATGSAVVTVTKKRSYEDISRVTKRSCERSERSDTELQCLASQ